MWFYWRATELKNRQRERERENLQIKWKIPEKRWRLLLCSLNTEKKVRFQKRITKCSNKWKRETAKCFCGNIETVCICQTSKPMPMRQEPNKKQKKQPAKMERIDVDMSVVCFFFLSALRNFLVYLFSVALNTAHSSSNSIVKMLIHC